MSQLSNQQHEIVYHTAQCQYILGGHFDMYLLYHCDGWDKCNDEKGRRGKNLLSSPYPVLEVNLNVWYHDVLLASITTFGLNREPS